MTTPGFIRSPSALGTRLSPIDISTLAGPSQRGRINNPRTTPRTPEAFFTTFKSSKPGEFLSSQQNHSFNLQLSRALRVDSLEEGRWQSQVIVPGHISLTACKEAFQCVVWPADRVLTLQVVIPPDWLEEVGQNEFSLWRPCSEMRSILGHWNPQLRLVAMQLAEALSGSRTANRCRTDELYLELGTLLLHRQQCGSAKPIAGRPLSVRRIRKAVDFMHAHIGEEIRLATLAAQVNLSPFHFARCFKATVGVSPHEYLFEMRIERARSMLVSTEVTMTEIALSLGFDSPSHFSSSFRTRTGMSPSMFRNQHT